MNEYITNIIIAALAFAGTIAGSYATNNKTIALIKLEPQHVKDDIKELDEKVHKHNNLVERMAAVEQSTKSAHHRIDDFKKE